MSQTRNELANAFNTAVERHHKAERDGASERASSRAAIEAAAAARRAAAQELKDTAIRELEDFASAIDALRVERTDAGLVLSHDSNVVSFDARGDGPGIALVGTGNTADRLDPDIDGRWMLTLSGKLRPLWNYGVQELLITALGLPRPAKPLPDPGPPTVRRAPRLQASIAPPRPAVRRED